MIENSSYKDPGLKDANFEENIAQILGRAVKLFQKTNLHELSEKWDRILNTYKSKKMD